MKVSQVSGTLEVPIASQANCERSILSVRQYTYKRSVFHKQCNGSLYLCPSRPVGCSLYQPVCSSSVSILLLMDICYGSMFTDRDL